MLNLLRDWLVQQGLGGQTAAFVTTAVEIALVITLAAIADIVVRRIILRQLENWSDRPARFGTTSSSSAECSIVSCI